MREISMFTMVSLDGFFEGKGHDLSWHKVDSEFNNFAIRQLKEADTLIMGSKTYQLMEGFWPTKAGLRENPVVARMMNTMQKIVFSKTIGKVKETEYWKNVRLVKNNVAGELKKLKKLPGKDLLILTSSNLCTTLLEMDLLDELRIMINPVVIGNGTRLFEGFKFKLSLSLFNTKTFGNGNVLLYYRVSPQ
ncbi:MAG: dihydrofolate reductase family protein [Patescibacteria group bacterium]|nr:dihydrofolate reductase family protein [Patescibacteria group bacterium]